MGVVNCADDAIWALVPDDNVAVRVASKQFAIVSESNAEDVLGLFLLLEHTNLLLKGTALNVPEKDVPFADADERVLFHWVKLNCQDSITGGLWLWQSMTIGAFLPLPQGDNVIVGLVNGAQQISSVELTEGQTANAAVKLSILSDDVQSV